MTAAEEGGGDGGEGAEEAFGVAGVFVEAAGVEGALGEGDDVRGRARRRGCGRGRGWGMSCVGMPKPGTGTKRMSAQ